MNCNITYNRAEKHFQDGDFHNAFILFKEIAENSYICKNIRADAFNMLGAIILFDTTIDQEDESGLNYFLAAIEIDPFNIGALFNIIENFGLSVNSHKNIKAFDLAVENLNKTGYKLNIKEKDMLNNKNAIRNKIINNLKNTYRQDNIKD